MLDWLEDVAKHFFHYMWSQFLQSDWTEMDRWLLLCSSWWKEEIFIPLSSTGRVNNRPMQTFVLNALKGLIVERAFSDRLFVDM